MTDEERCKRIASPSLHPQMERTTFDKVIRQAHFYLDDLVTRYVKIGETEGMRAGFYDGKGRDDTCDKIAAETTVWTNKEWIEE